MNKAKVWWGNGSRIENKEKEIEKEMALQIFAVCNACGVNNNNSTEHWYPWNEWERKNAYVNVCMWMCTCLTHWISKWVAYCALIRLE